MAGWFPFSVHSDVSVLRWFGSGVEAAVLGGGVGNEGNCFADVNRGKGLLA